MTNLCSVLETPAAAHPDRIAVVLGDIRLTYAEIDALAGSVADLLASRGIGRGDRVALSCPNLPYFPIVYFGILKAGATVVPLNVLLKPAEISYHLSDCEAVAYFAFEGTSELPMGAMAQAAFDEVESCESLFTIGADPATAMPWLSGHQVPFTGVAVDEDDTAVILYTSGTTGQPKGAELRHRNMLDNVLVGQDLFEPDPERPDTYLCALPLFHSYGQTVTQNSAFHFGGTMVLMPRFDPVDAIATMVREQVTNFAGVPTMYWALLNAVPDEHTAGLLAANLRVASSGGAALSAEIHRRFRESFGVTILEGYGLSETSPTASFARFGQEPRVGSIGLPIPGVEMKLLGDDGSEISDDPEAVGEIAIKGHNVMKGYAGRPEATAEVLRDGWFRTGDLARRDEDGYYYIVDRSKDMIIRGGFNVYPREIEELYMSHPDVSLVAVVGVPDDSHGEEIKAFVVPQEGSAVEPEELVAWGKERLASYKYPRIVEIVGSMPMTATGKILKRELSTTGGRDVAAR
ncbi:long-chain fatty acid--CoA ligase [Aeromicrobium sp. YIM 150415]|uniref:long-chain-fatty-acid--CoA ligase n=1 Tax=Aeromicrobium sp. YIM 150415 TaxID=2803912 RepID=UPI0019628FCF|nr:long-chain fatty acid--CoA ligase [Aeromicrobium sp. YIM 150415]MBM9461964.1 long-chain fatty acid--CoA ligase [Aeromicrobium sp. YIM 150415]